MRVRSCSFLGTEPDIEHAIKKANLAVFSLSMDEEDKLRTKEKKIVFSGDLFLNYAFIFNLTEFN